MADRKTLIKAADILLATAGIFAASTPLGAAGKGMSAVKSLGDLADALAPKAGNLAQQTRDRLTQALDATHLPDGHRTLIPQMIVATPLAPDRVVALDRQPQAIAKAMLAALPADPAYSAPLLRDNFTRIATSVLTDLLASPDLATALAPAFQAELLARTTDLKADTAATRSGLDELTRIIAGRPDAEALRAELIRAQAELQSTQKLITSFASTIVDKKVRPEDVAGVLFGLTLEWQNLKARADALDASANMAPAQHEIAERLRQAVGKEDPDRAWTLLSELDAEETARADRLAREAEQLDRQRATQARERVEIKEAMLASAALRLDVEAAVRLEVELAQLAGDAGALSLIDCHNRRCIRGERVPGRFDLDVALGLAEIALQVARTEPDRGRAWACKGNALKSLANRGHRPDLSEVAAAFEEASKLITEAVSARDWAGIRMNLGMAWQAIGDRNQDQAALHRAICCLNQALSVQERERLIADTGQTRNNLGVAYLELARQTREEANLKQAIANFNMAADIYVHAQAWGPWAKAKANLGNAYRSLGTRINDRSTLQLAIEAYGVAKGIFTRRQFPVQWAGIRENTAICHLTLRDLPAALSAVEDALTVFTAPTMPLDHGRAAALRDKIRDASTRSDGSR